MKRLLLGLLAATTVSACGQPTDSNHFTVNCADHFNDTGLALNETWSIDLTRHVFGFPRSAHPLGSATASGSIVELKYNDGDRDYIDRASGDFRSEAGESGSCKSVPFEPIGPNAI